MRLLYYGLVSILVCIYIYMNVTQLVIGLRKVAELEGLQES